MKVSVRRVMLLALVVMVVLALVLSLDAGEAFAYVCGSHVVP
jgi:hypothetical protein